MKHESFISPFPHVEVENLLTKEENEYLYSASLDVLEPYKEDLESFKYWVLDEQRHKIDEFGLENLTSKENKILVQNNHGVWLYTKEYLDIQNRVNTRLSKIQEENLDDFPILISPSTGKKMKWSVNLCISNNIHTLYPHSDDIYAIGGHMGYSDKKTIEKLELPRYKGILYVGDLDLDYKDYGTRFYTKQEQKNASNPFDGFVEEKEVKYIPRNAHFFKTQPNSYHGTDFKEGFPHKRIFGTISYY